jgi:hypothetical protein
MPFQSSGFFSVASVTKCDRYVLCMKTRLLRAKKFFGTFEKYPFDIAACTSLVSAHHRHGVREADEGGWSRISPSWRSAVAPA